MKAQTQTVTFMGKMRMETVNISLPQGLREKLDLLVEKGGYSSRSEAVREALRGFLSETEFLSKVSGTVLGAVVIMYDTHRRGISDELTGLQHRYSDVVLATSHGHMGDLCLEAVLVRGDVRRVKELVERSKALRGIETAKIMVLSA